MKKFEHEVARRQLDQRRHRGVPEHAVRIINDLLELGRCNLVADEAADHGVSDIRIGFARKTGDFSGTELGPGLRHIEPAIRSKASENCVREAEHGCLTAR